jgi:hypothetical protein
LDDFHLVGLRVRPDDDVYRLVAMMQIAGALVLVLAAGVPTAFAGGNDAVVWAGYVIVRLAIAGPWIRVGDTGPGAATGRGLGVSRR